LERCFIAAHVGRCSPVQTDGLTAAITYAAGGRRFVSAGIAMALYAFGMETIQQLRGIDPRFSHVAGPIDSLLAPTLAWASPSCVACCWTC